MRVSLKDIQEKQDLGVKSVQCLGSWCSALHACFLQRLFELHTQHTRIQFDSYLKPLSHTSRASIVLGIGQNLIRRHCLVA